MFNQKICQMDKNLRYRLIAVLNKLGEGDIGPEVQDDANLIEFGVDDLANEDSLPFELQQEFDVCFDKLDKVETFGEVLAIVKNKLEKKPND